MSSRFLFPLLVPCLLVPSACGGGDQPSAAGASITVKVDGRTHQFRDSSAELKSFLGGSWLFEVSSGQGDGTDLSFAFFTDAKTAAALSGLSLENDYREHNAERYPIEEILNFVRVGKKEYQGYLVKGTVRSVTDKQITLDIQGTFLEFEANWEEAEDETPPTGRDVEVSASITLPLEVETPGDVPVEIAPTPPR